MNSFCVLGLMSGTSLDGLDIAAVEFTNTNDSWQYKLKVAETVSYPKPLLNRLKIAVELSIEEHQMLDIDFGQFIGEAVNDFKTKHLIDIDFVCSHGHTSHHKPHQGVTQQLGDAKAIYQKCKIPVINNFRALDVSLGGQGAPLVPIGDELLFAEYDFCLNLGGISNISYVNEAQRIAFDIGMANMPLNYLAGKFQKEYDKDGEIALAGEVNKALLALLNELDYYAQSPPKSLGIEWFQSHFRPILDAFDCSLEDKMSTVIEHNSYQISKVISEICKTNSTPKVLITGGGIKNPAFKARLIKYLEKCAAVVIPDQELVDYKEALIFAFMGVLRFRGEQNVLASVTGASRNSSSGDMYGFN
jgi:anhydro-N-acetylmuramic acid kinase